MLSMVTPYWITKVDSLRMNSVINRLATSGVAPEGPLSGQNSRRRANFIDRKKLSAAL